LSENTGKTERRETEEIWRRRRLKSSSATAAALANRIESKEHNCVVGGAVQILHPFLLCSHKKVGGSQVREGDEMMKCALARSLFCLFCALCFMGRPP